MRPIRRVVTAHDAAECSIIAHDGALPNVVKIEGIPGTVFHEVWSTASTPVSVDNGDDPTLGPVTLPPPPGGTRVRFVDIPPDTDELLAHGVQHMQEVFEQIGAAHASTAASHSPHPLMHRTESVDYGVVIEGEIVLVLDRGEVALRAGDVVIQRGTNHAWANRSGRVCRMLFMLVDGRFNLKQPPRR